MTEKKQPDPPEFISEATRIEIEANGSALDTFTGRVLTREDLKAYQVKTKGWYDEAAPPGFFSKPTE